MPMEGQFIRTHVAAYFVSLLITDLLQAIGSIMNARWTSAMSATYGEFCVAQGEYSIAPPLLTVLNFHTIGVIKQMSDVGTATWSVYEFTTNSEANSLVFSSFLGVL